MTIREDREAWFPEPARADDTAANRGELTTEWLKRSTHPRAIAARRFLNENLSALPLEHRADLYRALHDRWGSAFFELIVGRTLQALGATIEIEPGGASDVRVDFAARFPGGTPTQVIVHRDGRYLAGELDDLIDALQDVPRLTLVSIKKDTRTRLASQQLEGAFVEPDERTTILVTNTQAQHSSMPVPIEVELVHSDRLSMRQVVSQVFWLTRVCQGNANFPKRLPATTGWANNVAGTGRRLHLKGWEYGEA